jgi:phage regulator Rha-like protein
LYIFQILLIVIKTKTIGNDMAKKKNEVVVYIKDNDLKVGTGTLSKGFGVEHRALKRLVMKYKNEFETWGLIATPLPKVDPENKGRRLEEYELNEPQATYLSTLLTNNETVRRFKHILVEEFFRLKKILGKLLAQKQNAEWLQKRQEGKEERRLETDTIKEFVEYAKGQGSQSADKYYMIISKMENKTLFYLDYLSQKYPNIRDIAQGFQLTSLQVADRIVAKAIKEGMEQKLSYKDIYLKAKENVEQFAKIIGKTPLQLAIDEHILLQPKS